MAETSAAGGDGFSDRLRHLRKHLEGASDEAAKAHFEDRELLQQFQAVEKVSEEDKAVVRRFLDAFLIQKQLQELVAR